MLYSCMLILNAFVLSAIITTARTAILFAASLWLSMYAIFSTSLAAIETTGEPLALVWLLIFFNNFLPFGLRRFEDAGKEQIFSEIWLLLILQICCILFYWCWLQYANRRLLCSPYHIKRTKYQRNAIGLSIVKSDVDNTENISSFYADLLKTSNWSNFEYGPIEGHLLMLQNVTVYAANAKKPMQLLENISMRIFKNEISVILGPRSCGKTALLSTLAGRHRYDGHIYYDDNKEISENWLCYSRDFDISMSHHNPLHDLLTVEEQLNYIICQKMIISIEGDLIMELNKWLVTLKPFIADTNRLVKTLNFDEKRLLTLCCTLSCNRSIILLDEPTLHMSCDERLAYWQILQKEKLNRAIIITTSSMDLANEIGDRVAILKDGNLKAWATTFYLKTSLSKGMYLVTVIKNYLYSTRCLENNIESESHVN